MNAYDNALTRAAAALEAAQSARDAARAHFELVNARRQHNNYDDNSADWKQCFEAALTASRAALTALQAARARFFIKSGPGRCDIDMRRGWPTPTPCFTVAFRCYDGEFDPVGKFKTQLAALRAAKRAHRARLGRCETEQQAWAATRGFFTIVEYYSDAVTE